MYYKVGVQSVFSSLKRFFGFFIEMVSSLYWPFKFSSKKKSCLAFKKKSENKILVFCHRKECEEKRRTELFRRLNFPECKFTFVNLNSGNHYHLILIDEIRKHKFSNIVFSLCGHRQCLNCGPAYTFREYLLKEKLIAERSDSDSTFYRVKYLSRHLCLILIT